MNKETKNILELLREDKKDFLKEKCVKLEKKYLVNRAKYLSKMNINDLNDIINNIDASLNYKEKAAVEDQDRFVSWNTIIHDIRSLIESEREDQSSMDITKGLELSYLKSIEKVYADMKVLLYDIATIQEHLEDAYQCIESESLAKSLYRNWDEDTSKKFQSVIDTMYSKSQN